MIKIIEKVQQIIGCRRAAADQQELSAGHEIWTHFNDDHWRALNALIHNPFLFNPDKFPNIFSRTEELDVQCLRHKRQMEIPTRVIFYLRLCRMSKKELKDNLKVYAETYYADSEWASGILHHLEDHLESIKDNKYVSLIYIGATHAADPDKRLHHDISKASHTRFTNWNAVSNSRWIAYSIDQISIQCKSFSDLLNHPTAGLMESTWITAVGAVSVNSAKGGISIDWAPSEANTKVWEVLKLVTKPCAGDNQEPNDQLIQSIQEHFHDYKEFMARVPSINPRSSEGFLKAVIETATPTKISATGNVTSILLCKQVTAQNVRDEIGFWHPSAGVSPRFFKELVRHFSPNGPLPVQVDLFALSPQEIVQIGIPYTTRYLKLLQPTLILAQSSLVNGLLQLDTFNNSWSDNLDQQQKFLKQLQSPDSLAGLSNILNTHYPSTNIKKKFTSQIGLVSIVRYGPAFGDICLSMAIRDPGNLRYDPSNQQAKCEELYATLCCFYLLEEVVYQHQQAAPRPKDPVELQAWLVEIKKKYEQTVVETKLDIFLDSKKLVVMEQNHTAYSARITSARQRSLPKPPTTNKTDRFTCYFLGEAGDKTRQEQLVNLREKEEDRRKRGLVQCLVPCPPSIDDIFSDEYATWFLSRRKAANMHQSARATGRDPMEHLNDEQRQEYLKKRQFGPFSPIERIVNRNTPSVIDTVLHISDEHRWTKTATNELVWIATCLFCDDTFLASHNTFHRCPIIGIEMHSQRDGLKYFRVLYAHDILDLPNIQLDENGTCINSIGIEASDAVSILKESDSEQFKHLNIGELGQIYTVKGSSPEWNLTNAMDRWISTTGNGIVDMPNAHVSDSWLYDKPETMNILTKHLNDPIRRQSPLVHITCGVVDEPLCNYNTLSHPSRTRDIKEGMTQIPFTTQHPHRLTDAVQDALEEQQKLQQQHQGMKRKPVRGNNDEESPKRKVRGRSKVSVTKSCKFGNSVTTFIDLPMAGKRYLWMKYRQSTDKEKSKSYDPLTWKSTLNRKPQGRGRGSWKR